jgi:anthraniloyl-CoA monooxygenase
MRYPLEILDAVRERWEKPLSVRISATDWVKGGIIAADAVAIATALKAAGVDIVNVSSGQTSVKAEPVYGRMFQTPFAERIRLEVGIPTIAVGNIFEADHVNSILAAGRADLCALARPHLADPNWTLHAAAELGYDGVAWPNPYLTGKEQLQRLTERAQQMAQII